MLALKESMDCGMSEATMPVRGTTAPVATARDVANNLTIELYDRMEPLAAEWQQLESDPLNSLHHSWAWCSAWVETHKSRLAIIRGERGGQTLFILPLEINQTRLARMAGFIGDAFGNLGTGLIAASFRRDDALPDPQSFSTALASLLAGRADIVVLRNLPRHWRGSANPFTALGAGENHNRSFQLPLLGDMETTLKQVNAKRRRKKFRNQQRTLEAIGGYEHIIAETSEEKKALLDLFFQQKAARFAAQGLPDVFADVQTQAFFHALTPADDGGHDAPLRLHAVRLKGAGYAGHIVAITGLSLQGDHVICQFGSIDETHAMNASPGELLFWLAIEWCVDNGYALFDFGIGDQPYKRSWCPQETPLHDLLMPLNLRGHVARAAALGIINAKAFIKRHRWLYSSIQRLRSGRKTTTDEERSEDQAA